MIRKIAWETFKNTGDINSFMELKQIENIEKEIKNELDSGASSASNNFEKTENIESVPNSSEKRGN